MNVLNLKFGDYFKYEKLKKKIKLHFSCVTYGQWE